MDDITQETVVQALEKAREDSGLSWDDFAPTLGFRVRDLHRLRAGEGFRGDKMIRLLGELGMLRAPRAAPHRVSRRHIREYLLAPAALL